MTFNWPSPAGSVTLSMSSEDSSLRPWDAADEFLLGQTASYPEAGNIAVINDAWGALSAALGRTAVSCWTDSLGSRRAVEENRRANGSPPPLFTDSIEDGPLEADLILMKIPTSLELFAYQLDRLRRRAAPGTPVLAGALSRRLPASFFACFEEQTEGAAYSRILKKARYYHGTIGVPETNGTPSPDQLETFLFDDLTVQALPGVFSRGRLDRGTRFLLEHFPRVEAPRRVIDPGCGSGILSLAAARAWPEARITATDNSRLAVESTRLSAVENGFASRITTLQTDILEGVEDGDADLVMCNPPFHQGRTVSVETGFRFIRESARVLKPRGELFLVANRHLGYRKELERSFSRVTVIAQNRDFRIYKGRK